VQFAGGLVLAAMGWQLLDEKDKDDKPAKSSPDTSRGPIEDQIFYPLTFLSLRGRAASWSRYVERACVTACRRAKYYCAFGIALGVRPRIAFESCFSSREPNCEHSRQSSPMKLEH